MDERMRHATVRVILPNMDDRIFEGVEWFRVSADGVLELRMSDARTLAFECDGWVDVRFEPRD